jgi:glycosyltransferase involved in cell wall biosynthesis
MKIALIVPGGVDRSGEVRVIPALLALIERVARVHELHVFALRQEHVAATWEFRGARIHNAGAGFRAGRAFRQLLREHRVGPFDVFHSIFAGSCGSIAVGAGRWLQRPACVHVAGGELVSIPDIGYGGRQTLRGRWMSDWSLRGARCVTAASQPIIDSVTALGIVARRVPLGVDLERWPRLAPRTRSGAIPRLIQVASINRVKDHELLLGALRLLAAEGRDFHVDVVGEDLLSGVIQARARAAGLESRMTFHGFLTQRQMRPLIERAHINLITSRHEAGPLAALEAAVAGVPTVGTAVGHLVEWAPDAASVVPVQRPDLLSTAIAQLLDDDELRVAKAQAAARIALAEDADLTARLFMEIYRELADKPGGVRAR